MELVAIGIVAGVIGALMLTRVLASMLFGISTKDALTFLAVPAILVAVACAATVIPAWRATSVDPIVALRDE
jgi:ABC-type antimicrobial peptide transport system permease subunit